MAKFYDHYEEISVLDLASQAAKEKALVEYATYAHEIIDFIHKNYWEKAGVNWEGEERMWNKVKEFLNETQL